MSIEACEKVLCMPLICARSNVHKLVTMFPNSCLVTGMCKAGLSNCYDILTTGLSCRRVCDAPSTPVIWVIPRLGTGELTSMRTGTKWPLESDLC